MGATLSRVVERGSRERAGYLAGMFFFSNRLGCLPSLLLSIVATAILFVLLNVI